MELQALFLFYTGVKRIQITILLWVNLFQILLLLLKETLV